MPSPFPGMDPYLERPSLWPDVHAELISGIRASLMPRLRPKYFAQIEDRVYISDDRDPGRQIIVPDINISVRDPVAAAALPSNGGVLLAEVQPIEAVTFFETEVRESRISILDSQDQSVVTVIEVLSPANKFRGAAGERSYLDKRHLVMESTTNLVEIDLLRSGNRIPAASLLPPCDYLIHVSRRQKRPRATIWPVRLAQRLPEVPIPLRDGDSDLLIDLQTILNFVYERAGYDAILDYQSPPEPPLSPEQAEWADAVLRRAGLRGPAPA